MMEKKINIAVIFGGRSGEHEVSLMSAASVLAVLDPSVYSVTQIGITQEGVWLTGDSVLEKLSTKKFDELQPVTLFPEPRGGQLYIQKGNELDPYHCVDVVFPVLHGTFGEDGTLQGLLELADVAYVGCGVLGSAVGMDKGLFKDVMIAHNIPVVDYLVTDRKHITSDVNDVISNIESSLPYPVFVKPANLGSSVGISKSTCRSDLLEGLMEAARFDRRIVVERGVNAREIEVSVLGNEDPIASVPGEIKPSEDFYDYKAKYQSNRSELVIPAPLDEALTARIRNTALEAYKAIDGCGLARVDFLLDRETDELYISEVNTIPGFTSISMYSKLWQATGLTYAGLVDELVRLALDRKNERDATERTFRRDE